MEKRDYTINQIKIYTTLIWTSNLIHSKATDFPRSFYEPKFRSIMRIQSNKSIRTK